MRVLVTGGAGFIGSHVVDTFVARGHQVSVVDDLSSGRREQVNPRARFHRLDVRSPAITDLLMDERPQLVDHHAAQISVTRSVREPAFDADVNVLGSLNLFNSCIAAGVKRVLFASTGGAIYGETRRMPTPETEPARPIAPYGIAKRTVEHYLEFFRREHGLSCLVLRYSNVYGPRQDPHGEAGVVAIFSRALLEGQSATIFGTGEATRDYVYVGDVVSANLLAAESQAEGILNIGTGIRTSTRRIYDLIAAAAGVDQPPAYGPPRAGDLANSCLDARRAQLLLGWKPTVSLEEGIRLTVDYFRKISGNV